jgi:ribosomal protein L40E
MPDGTVICRRCGVTNTSGDQFCGSCGAFLEWEGDTTEASPPMAPASAASAASPAPLASAPTVICPACGHANPTSRTFCQKCGQVLDTRTPLGPGDPVAAPVARPSPPPASGGIPSWLPIVAVIGLLAGVGFVVASIVMRPAPVPPGATTVPSVTFTPTLPPSAAVPSSDVPSAPPAESVQLTLTGATASSVVGNKEKFDAAKVIDGSLETCWQEGSADEKGEWVEVTFEPSRLDYVVIYSGYQLSNDAYRANRRPENILVSVNGGAPIAFVLADSEQPQRLDVDDAAGATTVRIEIVTTFDSEATSYPGSPFDDLAISEIRAFGEAGG